MSDSPTEIIQETARIPAANVELEGDIALPQPGHGGLVLFAHGTGSSRHSPRNRYVAKELQGAGLATVLVDLLTPDEERLDLVTSEIRFDVGLLSRRLADIVDWLSARESTRELPVGLFGASTGAAAALVAAAARPDTVRAVVSRGGRPDLAGDFLRLVYQPTLLIVGGHDEPVIELNRKALEALPGPKQLEIVPGATHLFEEPGMLEEVAALARDWFVRHVTRAPHHA
jgi:putative phosphoribosyl transferase